MWSLNCDSDHSLVKTIIKQKLIRTQINVAKQTKCNQNNFHNPAKLKQYRTCLYNKLIIKEAQDIREEWTHIKKPIIESGNEIIQTQSYRSELEFLSADFGCGFEHETRCREVCSPPAHTGPKKHTFNFVPGVEKSD
jgi:hypothetical protein